MQCPSANGQIAQTTNMAPNRKPRYFFGEYSASSEVEWDVGHESGTLKAWGRALCPGALGELEGLPIFTAGRTPVLRRARRLYLCLGRA